MACGTLAVRSFKGQLKVITAVAIYNYNCVHEKFQIEIDEAHVVNEDEVGSLFASSVEGTLNSIPSASVQIHRNV